MTTSCQPRPQPHSSGIAATRATSGTATNRPTMKRWSPELGSSSKSGRGVRGCVLTAPPSVPPGAGAWSVRAEGGAAEAAPVARTVSGEVVIVLLWVQAEQAGAFIRLRNRSLPDRRLGNTSRMNFCKWTLGVSAEAGSHDPAKTTGWLYRTSKSNKVPAPGLEPGLTQLQRLVRCQLRYAGLSLGA